MASTSENSPSTDSATTLRNLVGNDPTATFENDPRFVESNPTGNASSENLGAAQQADPEEEDDLDEEGEEEEEEEDSEEDDEEDDDANEAGAEPPLRVDGLHPRE